MVIPGYTLNLRPLGGWGDRVKEKKILQSVGLYFTETKFKVWMMLRLCGGSGGKNKEGRLGPTSCQARQGGGKEAFPQSEAQLRALEVESKARLPLKLGMVPPT